MGLAWFCAPYAEVLATFAPSVSFSGSCRAALSSSACARQHELNHRTGRCAVSFCQSCKRAAICSRSCCQSPPDEPVLKAANLAHVQGRLLLHMS